MSLKDYKLKCEREWREALERGDEVAAYWAQRRLAAAQHCNG